MKDKFIITPEGGVGFNGAMGVANLAVEEVVKMLNEFNNTCQRLEDMLKGESNG